MTRTQDNSPRAQTKVSKSLTFERIQKKALLTIMLEYFNKAQIAKITELNTKPEPALALCANTA